MTAVLCFLLVIIFFLAKADILNKKIKINNIIFYLKFFFYPFKVLKNALMFKNCFTYFTSIKIKVINKVFKL